VAPEEEWILVEEIREEATEAVGRGSKPARRSVPEPITLDDEVKEQLTRAVGATKGDRVEKRLKEASKDFQRERFGDAERILRPLAEQAPGVASVRELYGLTLYRLGKWRLAVRELEAFRTMTASTESNPVLADCYRALRQWSTVDELWNELKSVSPSAELVTEGRIVTAGAKADRRDLTGAIELLEQGWRFPKKPQDHHLRRAYALADLYERAGDLPRARDLFQQIASFEPDFADVGIRIRSLR
jgi:tetratricopeptide (TPR) repeat protein